VPTISPKPHGTMTLSPRLTRFVSVTMSSPGVRLPEECSQMGRHQGIKVTGQTADISLPQPKGSQGDGMTLGTEIRELPFIGVRPARSLRRSAAPAKGSGPPPRRSGRKVRDLQR
jgi:hypothetical protein